MKKTNRLFALFVLATLLIGIFQVSSVDLNTPEGPIIVDDYKSICTMSASTSIVSNGLATCSTLVSTYNFSNAISISLTLQRSIDGGTWSPLYTWSASGIGTVAKTGSRYVTSGYYYRCVVNATIRSSSGTFIESAYLVSNTVHY